MTSWRSNLLIPHPEHSLGNHNPEQLSMPLLVNDHGAVNEPRKRPVDKQEGLETNDQLFPPPQSWFGGEEQMLHEKKITEENQDPVSNGDFGTRDQLSMHYVETEIVPPPPGMPIVPHSHLSGVGAPRKAPSWKELSSQVLPAAARELLSSSMRRVVHTACLSYAKGRWHRNYSEIGNPHVGYFRSDLTLPPFSSLPWVDRQLVSEWRTIGFEGDDDDEDHFETARTLIPQPIQRPKWRKADICQTCRKPFGPTLLRHHCRLCGNSFCHSHSNQTHSLPHLGYDPRVPERICLGCMHVLKQQQLAERVAWRMARCRDYFDGSLAPYFDTGIDTVEDAALRLTKAAIAMARSIPLGAQAHVAVETVEVLRKYGLKGIYGMVLRKEFLAAADLLCQACDINQATFPLSAHELSAAIFYALAQHRAMRGVSPEQEHIIHTLRRDGQERTGEASSTWTEPNAGSEPVQLESLVDETDQYNPRSRSVTDLIALADAAILDENRSNIIKNAEATSARINDTAAMPFRPVCEPVPDDVLSSCLFYAPIALNFIYVEREVDMQLLAAQQGWRLLYSHLQQESNTDRPGSALFLHDEKRIACLAVRGTATIHDVVTDIRQMPVPFPESDMENIVDADDWTAVFRGQGLAVCGMTKAAVNLFQEHIDVISHLASKSFKIRVVGHSLGAGVATLLGTLIKRHLETNCSKVETDLVRVYGYASPSCVDAKLSDYLNSFVTTVVLHDDVVPRLTPTSIRGLIKHLLHIRETWVQLHLKEDLMALTERARTAWAPRWKSGFTLRNASGFCRKQLRYGKRKLLSAKGMTPNFSRQRSTSHEKSAVTPTNEAYMPDFGSSDEEKDEENSEVQADRSPKLVVEFMGGLDKHAKGTVIDGDEFFDPEDSLVEKEEDGFEDLLYPVGDFSQREAVKSLLTDDMSVASGQKPGQEIGSPAQASLLCESGLEEIDDQSSAVMLEETPLPRMYLPGKIVHIYTHRGGYKATFVPRTFRDLRRISLAGNMLGDHKCKSYFEALMEVQTVRLAEEGLPQWTAFDEDDTCSCCASRFTWASTSDSEAQEARDKHNCRSCGTLCCDPCSKNRMPLPSVGLTALVRVCDRCYNDLGSAGASKVARANSFSEVTTDDSDEVATFKHQKGEQRPQQERKRERRSLVVDELASRVHSTVSVHN